LKKKNPSAANSATSSVSNTAEATVPVALIDGIQLLVDAEERRAQSDDMGSFLNSLDNCYDDQLFTSTIILITIKSKSF